MISMKDEMLLTDINIENNFVSETDDTKFNTSNVNITTDFIGKPFNYQTIKDLEDHQLISEYYIKNSFKTRIKNSQKFFTYISQKRGRKTQENENSAKIHGKFDKDNITRKIQVSYINFITDLLNEILVLINRKDLHFMRLHYLFKRVVNKSHRNNLKKQTIEEVLRNKISSKYSIKKRDVNIEICEKIKKENINILINILNKNIFFFFDKIYYKNCRKFNFKEFGLEDIEVQLSPKIELFEDLMTKNRNDIHFQKYKLKLNECAKKYFLPEKKEIFKCNY